MARKSEPKTKTYIALMRLERDGGRSFVEPGETVALPAETAALLLASGRISPAASGSPAESGEQAQEE